MILQIMIISLIKLSILGNVFVKSQPQRPYYEQPIVRPYAYPLYRQDHQRQFRGPIHTTENLHPHYASPRQHAAERSYHEDELNKKKSPDILIRNAMLKEYVEKKSRDHATNPNHEHNDEENDHHQNKQTHKVTLERLKKALKENLALRKSLQWLHEMIENLTNGLRNVIPDDHLSLVLGLLDKRFFEINKEFTKDDTHNSYYHYRSEGEDEPTGKNGFLNKLPKELNFVKSFVPMLCDNPTVDQVVNKANLGFWKGITCYALKEVV